MESTPRRVDGVVLDLNALLERLRGLTDTRAAKGRRYSLPMMLLLMVLAKLGGEDRPGAIAEWVEHRREQLQQALGLSWVKMPHHNTYRRILAEVVRAKELDLLIGQHLSSLDGVGESVVVAIDGKTLRGTIRNSSRGEHLLAAYLPEEGITLMQLGVGEKGNEVTAAPRLLKCVNLSGKVVLGDAEQTQRELSVQIIAAGGDYVWIAKDNQPTLRRDIEWLFAPDRPTVLGLPFPNDFTQARSVDKGHGRLEQREITVSSLLKGYSDWPGLEQVFKLVRQRTECATGERSIQTVYGFTSLSPQQATPARLLGLIRSYWGIESGLHCPRDTTFREDHVRTNSTNSGHVLAALNNLVIGLLRHAGATNLAEARRALNASITTSFDRSLTCLIT